MNPKGFDMLDKLKSELDDFKNGLIDEVRAEKENRKQNLDRNRLKIEADLKEKNSLALASLKKQASSLTSKLDSTSNTLGRGEIGG